MSDVERELRELVVPLRELTAKEKDFINFVTTDKTCLWLENRRLKKALKKAAEMVNKTYCPYDLRGEADFCAGGSSGCTFEDGAQCWMEYWMGEIDTCD